MLLTMGNGEFLKLRRRLPGALASIRLVIFTAMLLLSSQLNAKDAANSSQARERYERLFVLANTEFTLLHEIAHVLIWELKPPIFGGEEDAADTIAIMAQMMLPATGGMGDEVEKLKAVADGWKLEWQMVLEDELENAYWDLHSLEIQRYYDIACLVYGADPVNRAGIIKNAELPTDRSEWCEEEYALAKRSMDWLLSKLTYDPVSGFKTERGKVTVAYSRNTTLEGEKLDQWLHEAQIAERLAEAVTRRFDLPRDILIAFESCPFPNASWDAEKAEIRICHALLNRFLYLARELSKDRDIAADSTVWSAVTHSAAPRGSVNPSTPTARTNN